MVTIRISKAGACPRRILLEARGVEGLPPWEGSERAFAEGRLHEPSILEWAAQNLPGGPYTLTCQQYEVWVGFLVGHIDALARSKRGDAILLEAKCLSNRGFQEFREKGLRDSHPQYYTQVQLYLLGLRNAGSRITDAYLVARNKETPKTRLWDHHYERIPFDETYAKAEAERLHDLARTIADGGDIHPPYNPDENWQCRPPWCPYTYHCHPGWSRPGQGVEAKDDLATLAARYIETSEEIAALEAEREELKQRLLTACNGSPVRAGAWIVRVEERRQERFDTKTARQLLEPPVLAQLLKVVTYKQLKVEEVA